MPASQAENVNIIIGSRTGEGVCVWMGHMDRATYIDSIMLSKQIKAEIRWVRWKARPRLLRVNAA